VAAPAAENETVGSRRLTDWLTIGGSVLVIVSFFLPWATDGVIGSFGSGFTANWGLANPGHLVLIAAAAVVLILHAFTNTIPTWLRSGVLPLLVGGILAGLAFAYYARPAGGGAGVAVMLAGALVLIGGGMLACRPERHATGAPRV
jgi:pheromone shutdown protein TraB